MDSSMCSRPVPTPKLNIYIDKKIGSGRFHVYHATLPSQGTEYALKAFTKDSVSQEAYLREKEITSSLDHENIIKYISNINFQGLEGSKSDYIMMEYAPHGTFFNLVTSKGLLEEKVIRTYFHQVVEGLEYLHSQRISHGDLKLENLLLGEDFVLKITDFDQSQREDEADRRFTGTACYRAPEVLDGTCTDFMAADIYSMGVLLYAFKAQEFPFIEKHGAAGTDLIHYDLFTRRNSEFWQVKSQEKRTEGFFSQGFKDLINGMLEKDSNMRLSLEGIKRSRWYNEPVLDKKELKTKMEKIWERIVFKKALRRGKSFNK